MKIGIDIKISGSLNLQFVTKLCYLITQTIMDKCRLIRALAEERMLHCKEQKVIDRFSNYFYVFYSPLDVSASNRNEYQGFSLVVKAAGAYG